MGLQPHDQCNTGLMVTFPVAERYRPLTGRPTIL